MVKVRVRVRVGKGWEGISCRADSLTEGRRPKLMSTAGQGRGKHGDRQNFIVRAWSSDPALLEAVSWSASTACVAICQVGHRP